MPKENRDREETVSAVSPLRQTGYAIQPGKAVETFPFQESGTYTVEVSVEETTKEELFERTEPELTDETTEVVTSGIEHPNSIQVSYSGETS